MSKQPDITFVYPNNRHRAFGDLASEIAAISPPVQAGLLAGYAISNGLQASILDADAENVMPSQVAERIEKTRPTLVCINTDYLNSGDVTKIAAALETLKTIKARTPDIPVVLEGVVPTAMPEQMLREEGADFVIDGEGYDPIVNLVRHLKDHSGTPLEKDMIEGVWTLRNDELISSHKVKLKDPEHLPHIPWDMMPPSQYRAHHWHCFDDLSKRTPYASIYTNLGCPYACTFCSVNVTAGGPNFRQRQPEDVVKEIEYLVTKWGVRSIRILDNVFTVRLDLVEELCDRIIAKKFDLNFWAYARVESIRNQDILAKMKKAGVNWLAYGIEAASAKVREHVEKGSSQKIIARALDWTHEADIAIVGNFIFGLPEDDMESITESFDMAKQYNFEWANFYCAMAYPGTALHREVVEKGVPLPKNWSGYGQYSPDAFPLATEHLTSEEVLRFRDEAFKEYYTMPAYRSMLTKKFGPEAVAYVDKILEIELPRNYPQPEPA